MSGKLTLVEEMAKAIRKTRWPSTLKTWESLPVRDQSYYLREAEAALKVVEATRRPSAQMSEESLAKLLVKASGQHNGYTMLGTWDQVWTLAPESEKSRYLAMARAVIAAGQAPPVFLDLDLLFGKLEELWIGELDLDPPFNTARTSAVFTTKEAAVEWLNQKWSQPPRIFKLQVLKKQEYHLELVPTEETNREAS